MDKQEKRACILAAAAAGAILILLTSTLVRCAVSNVDAQDAEETPAITQAQAQGDAEPEATEDDTKQAVQTAQQASEQTATTLERLQAKSWAAVDGSGATLQAANGIVIEKSTDGKLSALTYTASQEQQANGQELVTLTLENGSKATLIVTEKDGEAQKVESDAFTLTKSYVAKSTATAGTADFKVTNLAERYLTLIDGKQTELRKALATHAAKASPQATQASFDGEVYLDLTSGLVSATFHLNDAASTIVSVSYKDGAFTAA